MLAKNKIGLLHVAKAQLKLTEDDWRAILRTYGGVASSRDLDDLGFMSVMGHLERCGFLSTGKKKNFGTRQGMASAAQVAKIRDLWAQFTAGEGTDATLGKWLERIFKISSIRFIPAEMATKVIGALNNMCTKGRHADR